MCQLKKVLAFQFFLLTMSCIVFAQDNIYKDGELYVKFNFQGTDKDYAKKTLLPRQTILNNDNWDELRREYMIEKVDWPFSNNNQVKLKSLQTLAHLYFEAFDKIEEFILRLESLNEIEYVKRVPDIKLGYVPTDTLYEDQWYLSDSNIVEQAWELTGTDESVIAVIDVGFQIDHEDIAGNLWRNTAEIENNGIDDDLNGYVDDIFGWDFADNDNDISPKNSKQKVWQHGTHVAGIAGAQTNNQTGIASISNNKAKLMCLKGSSNTSAGSLNPDAILSALDYAINNGAKVVNMSFYWYGSFVPELQTLINSGVAQGMIFVACAGNDNNEDMDVFPASLENVIAVAALNKGNKKASFSNYADWVDISAPGISILSTISYPDDTSLRYDKLSGTSQAAPFVSGLCALMLSHNKELNSDQIEMCIKNSADNIDDLNPEYTSKLGAGSVNVKKAMECAMQETTLNSLDILSRKIKVYPNPSTGQLYIELNAGKNATISILGLDGVTRLFYIANEYSINAPIKIETTTLVSGTYIIKIDYENNNISYKHWIKI